MPPPENQTLPGNEQWRTTMWGGKAHDVCSFQELLERTKFLDGFYREHMTREALHTRAIGRDAMAKGWNWGNFHALPTFTKTVKDLGLTIEPAPHSNYWPIWRRFAWLCAGFLVGRWVTHWLLNQ